MDIASFVDSVRAEATTWDQRGRLPTEVTRTLAGLGLLVPDLPPRYGGSDATPRQLGEVCAQLGGVCSALRGLVTVQSMVAAALARWGTAGQRERWLPALAAGERVAGFAATEPEAGSDLAAVRTRIERDPTGSDEVVVSGQKCWITFGEIADVYLVLGRGDAGPAAVLVEADRPGTTVEPVRDQLGMRAAHLAHLRFDRVRVPAGNLVAPPGFGRSHVVGTALDHGRFTVAWGCVGMARACLAYAAEHAAGRPSGPGRLADRQLVQGMLAQAVVDTTAAAELCRRAADLRAAGSPEAIGATVLAKYAAARAAASVSRDAVQIQGAAGCAPDSPVARFFRDAKVMQIIEGSDEVAQVHIAEEVVRRYARRPGAEVAA